MTQATEDGAGLSVADFVGQAFGDLPVGDSASAGDGSTTESAPAPESAPPESPSPDESASAPPDTPADAPSPETPDPAATPDVPADDPLASAVPLTYQVDGQTKTYEGIKVIGDDGAIIDPSALADVQRKLGQVEHLSTANQQLYGQVQQYEAVGGMQRFAQLVEERAVLDAVGQILVPMFVGKDGNLPDVNNVLRLLQQNADGTVGWNEGALRVLAGQIGNGMDRAKLEAGRTFQTSRDTHQTTQANAATQERLAGEAMQVGMQTLRNTFKDWTADDFAAAEKHLTHFKDVYVRVASKQDVEKYPNLTVGQTFIDLPRLQPWVEERNGYRAREAKTTTTVTKAAQENAARLLAAKPGAARPAAPQKPATPPPATRAQEGADSWDLMEKLAASSIRATP